MLKLHNFIVGSVLLSCSFILILAQLPPEIKLGGLFDSPDPLQQAALKQAVERINRDNTILPHSKLSVEIQTIPQRNSFYTAKSVCKLLQEGIAGIFGPQSPEAASHTQALADKFDIPHIETKWDFWTRQDKYMINLFPHPDTLGRAYSDLVDAWKWEKYVMLYDGQQNLFKLQQLMKSSIPPRRQAILRKLPDHDDYREVLREILRDTDVKNVLVDCEAAKAQQVLKQIQEVGLLNYQYSFIFTTLDLQILSLDDFKYGESNITAFRLVDPSRPEVQSVLRELNSLLETYSPSQLAPRYGNPLSRINGIPTEVALIYDAVKLFAKTLHALDATQRIDIRSLNCEQNEAWGYGSTILNYIKMVPMPGLTGLIDFNNTGYRTDISLDVIQLVKQGIKKIGTWEHGRYATLKFNWLKPDEPPKPKQSEEIPLYNRTLIVSTLMNDPFCMYKKSAKPLTGNDQYEGYTVELIKILAERLQFKYEIRLVPDSKYGGYNNATGKWDGMIKEILDQKADMAVADLTVTKARQRAVAFTMPFMNLGLTILFTTPKVKPPSLFSFMSPFALEVWIYVAFAFFGVSFVLFIISRITPFEWDNPLPCVGNPDFLQNQFSLSNSIWFTVGSIMQQGSDLAPKISPYEWTRAYPCRMDPENSLLTNELTLCNSLWFTVASLMRQKCDVYPKAVSTRMIGGIWWFFTLIMVSSYTANLATFLIVQELDESIKNLDDLTSQNKIQYGCVKGGATESFFKNSQSTDKQEIFRKMEKMVPNPIKAKNSEGIDQVLQTPGHYAFFLESTVVEYYIERRCGLAQVGGWLDNKGYGIALPKDSKYLGSFNSAVLKLQEQGVLVDLKRKWWKEERKEATCVEGGESQGVQALRLPNVGGVFVVLVGGCIIASLVSFCEFLWKARDIKVGEGESRGHEMRKDLTFALQCRGNVKPVKKKPTSPSEGGDEMGSTPYLDLGINSYGFPKYGTPNIPNGGSVSREGLPYS